MKVYIATRFDDANGRHEVDRLARAVKNAGLHDFSFIRDVEKYHHTFDDPKELWRRAYDEIGACDALLIDVSDSPAGGRLVEAGIAYALGKTVIIVKRHSTEHKALFDGISAAVITYDDDNDLTKQLRHFEKDHTFTVTDKSMLLLIFLLAGGVLGYFLAQLWIPLGVIGPIIYWLLVRQFVATMRAFDRVVIYIPLAALWVGVFMWLSTMNSTIAVAWGIIFWIIVLPALKLLKFSL